MLIRSNNKILPSQYTTSRELKHFHVDKCIQTCAFSFLLYYSFIPQIKAMQGEDDLDSVNGRMRFPRTTVAKSPENC